MGGRQLAQGGEVAAVVLGPRRPRAALSSGPATGTGHAPRKAGSSAGAIPLLDASPGDVDLDQHPDVRRACFASCASAESLATEWISRTCGDDVLHLAALQVADEVPRERPRVGARLRHQLLRAVLAQEREPGIRRVPSSSRATYLTAASSSTSFGSRPAPRPPARSAPSPPRRAPRRAPASRPPISCAMRSRLAPGDAAVTAVGEEQVRIAADRAEPGVVDLDARRARRCACDRLEVDPPAPPARAERVCDLRADLVAAAAGAGTDRGVRPRRRRPAHGSPRRPPPGRRPPVPRQPAWTIATAPGATSAIGRQSAVRTSSGEALRSRRLAVGLARLALGRRGAPLDVAAVDLPALDDGIEGDARRPRRLCSRLAATASGSSSVQRPRLRLAYAPSRHPAPPRREQRPPARQRDPDVLADGLERGGQVHGGIVVRR